MCGCRTLDLTNKLVTGSLRGLLEYGIHILDINKHYQEMCFDLSVDAKELKLRNVIFFENVEISKIDVCNSLILPSNILDESTKQCLDIIFRSLCIVTRRKLDHHLEMESILIQASNSWRRLFVLAQQILRLTRLQNGKKIDS